MFAFRYQFLCPLCDQTHSSGSEVLFASAVDGAVEAVLRKHQTCPYCTKSLAGLTVKVTVFL